MKKALCAGLLALTMAGSPVYASVPTFVVNKNNEIQQLVETLLQNDWVRNVLYCLRDVQSLLDLKNTVAQMSDFVKNLNIQETIGQMAKDTTDQLIGNLDSDLAKQFQAFKNPKGMLGINEINQALQKTMKDLGNFQPSGLAKSLDLPEYIKKGTEFVKQGSDYIRNGQKYTEEEMRKIWKQEGVGAYRTDSGCFSTRTGDPATDAALLARTGAPEYVKRVLQYNPTAVPEIQQAISASIIDETAGQSSVVRDSMTLNYAQAEKTRALQGLGAISAKYYDQEKGYRASVNESLDQYNKAMSMASNLADNTGPGEAIKAIAGLLATQVQQINTQNTMLLAINDALADEIKMLDRIGNMNIEVYSQALYQNMAENARQYEVRRGRQ